MTSDDVSASTVAVSIASITKVPLLLPMTDQTVAVSLTGACLSACSVCKGFKTHKSVQKKTRRKVDECVVLNSVYPGMQGVLPRSKNNT